MRQTLENACKQVKVLVLLLIGWKVARDFLANYKAKQCKLKHDCEITFDTQLKTALDVKHRMHDPLRKPESGLPDLGISSK